MLVGALRTGLAVPFHSDSEGTNLVTRMVTPGRALRLDRTVTFAAQGLMNMD